MPRYLRNHVLAMAALLLPAATATATAAGAAPHVRGEVIVKYAPGTPPWARAAVQRATGAGEPLPIGPLERRLRIRDGESVAETVAELRRRSDVEYAAPNAIAHASQAPAPPFMPNDPGAGVPGDWQKLQWNLLSTAGVNAPQAWQQLIAAGRPGATGVIVAVLDTGVAYSNRTPYLRSPDFRRQAFVKGYDFVDRDPFPHDANGHGTHIAGTIAESANNGIGLTGIAYNARIMPVRVLNRQGDGDAVAIAAGIRYAARHGAEVINLSLEFDGSVHAPSIPGIIAAVRYANQRGALIVGASGNTAEKAVAYPARANPVVSVGAITEHGCLADYSNDGPGLDIAAPGGGAAAPSTEGGCEPPGDGRDIFQLTLDGSVRKFGLPSGYQGTSMAAAHVSAVAALVIASGVIGPHPKPAAIERRLEATARDIGPPGYDTLFGAGLIDAAAATAPG